MGGGSERHGEGQGFSHGRSHRERLGAVRLFEKAPKGGPGPSDRQDQRYGEGRGRSRQGSLRRILPRKGGFFDDGGCGRARGAAGSFGGEIERRGQQRRLLFQVRQRRSTQDDGVKNLHLVSIPV